MRKKEYKKPEIQIIDLDNQISLLMASGGTEQAPPPQDGGDEPTGGGIWG